jgi:hypothetical protein
MLKKLSIAILTLLLASCATPSTTGGAGSDLAAYDTLPMGSEGYGTFSGSFSAPRYAKAVPASGYITWQDNQGKQHQLNITQVRQAPNNTYIWLGDNTERGFWLVDFDPSKNSTSYTGKMVKGIAYHSDITPPFGDQ